MPRLRLHGPPVVEADDSTTIALSAREAALLAWLQFEGPTPRARLAGLLWPAGTEAQARANLRQLLTRLRRGVGAVVTETQGLLGLGLDVLAPGSPADVLLAGLAFDDLPEFAQWLGARRDALARTRQHAVLQSGQASLARGDLDGALAAADALLAAQPESEEGWRLRMQALYERGDRAAAIAAWDACKDTLRSSFGVAPTAATNALGRLILDSEAGPSAAPHQPPALPLSLRRPPHLVGRDGLLAELARVLALGRSAVVSGPGGIGKSRVLQHAAAGMEPALRVQARPGDAVLGGALLTRLLTAALAQFAPQLDSATRRDLARIVPNALPEVLPAAAAAPAEAVRSELEHRRVLSAVLRALSTCQAAGLRLLVVDDLQYADDASLSALQFLVGHWLAQAADDTAPGVQVLCSARPQELSDAGQALVQTVAGHAQGHLFEMSPLGVPDVRALLDRLPLPEAATRSWGEGGTRVLAESLHTTVGGNPAFVLEALRCLFLDGFSGWKPGQPLPVPATLRDSVRLRVQTLPDDALQLAQLAAVAQGDFDTALAATAFGRPPLALAPLFAALESAQVFDGSQFSHDLVAEAVRGLLPKALLTPLHRLVAEHLIGRAGDDARIAHHLLAAGAPREAAPWLLKSARAARGRWRLAEAAAGFEAAARGFSAAGAATGEADRALALDAWCDALRCWVELRRFDATAAALDAAAVLLRTVPDQARWRARQVHHLINSQQVGEALQAAQRLVDELAASTAQLGADELVDALRAVCYAVQGGLPAARVLDLCERLQPVIEQAGGDALAGFALARAATLLWDAQPRAALSALEAVAPTLDDSSDPFLRRSVANQLMRVHQALGDSARALDWGQRLLAWLPQTPDDASFEADVLNLVALMQVALGQLAQGMATIDRLSQRQRAVGETMREVHAMTIALSFIAVGRHDEAQDWLDRHTHGLGRPGYAMHDVILALARARLAAARGEPVHGWTERLRAVAPLPSGGVLHRQVALASLEPLPLAELHALREELQQRGQAGLLRSVEIAAARAALAAQDLPLAAGHARAALQLAAAVNAWSDEPATLWLTAFEVLHACGAAAEADAALADGLAWVEQGSLQWTDAAHRSAWRTGNPLHRALLAHAAARGLDL